MKSIRLFFVFSVFICSLFLSINYVAAADAQQSGGLGIDQPEISIPEELGDAVAREAVRVREQIELQARSMFEREPLGWGWQTIHYLHNWALTLPMQIPYFMQTVMEQSRVLGLVGSMVMLTFLAAVFYSLFGRKKMLVRIENVLEPISGKLPQAVYPFFNSTVRIIVAALYPLVLLVIYLFINALIDYRAPWFQLTGRLLGLWACGAVVINLLREVLTRGLFEVTNGHGKTIFHLTHLAVLYAIFGVALFWAAKVYALRPDALALLKFAVSISIVIVLFSLHLKKKAMLSLLP